MTIEIRFTYIRGRGVENSLMLQIWKDGKPTDSTLVTPHVYADHPHELFHNYDSPDGRFIGVGLKYVIDEE